MMINQQAAIGMALELVDAQSRIGVLTLGQTLSAAGLLAPSARISVEWRGRRSGICDPHSYRGYYDHIAFEPSRDHDMSVAEFCALLNSTLGETYEGYKGGNYRMTKDAPAWIANYGDAGGGSFQAIERDGDNYVLRTGGSE